MLIIIIINGTTIQAHEAVLTKMMHDAKTRSIYLLLGSKLDDLMNAHPDLADKDFNNTEDLKELKRDINEVEKEHILKVFLE